MSWQWPDGAAVRVRMGIHTGEPLLGATGYVGMDVHRAARIAAAGHGGQILLSGTTRDLVADDLPEETDLRDLGAHRLKDLRGETRIYQVTMDGLPGDFPALMTASAEEPPPTPGEPPYRGLQAFEEADAALFFGREATVARLAEQVRGARFVALIGASGSGKSSILRAGLVPVLRRDGWRIHLLTPTAHPLESLAAAVAPDASPAQLAGLVDDLRRDPRSLALKLRAEATGAAGGRILIAVDQLEEIFTLCRDEEERAAFLVGLIRACGLDEEPAGVPAAADRATVIVTLRADFYAFLAPYPPLRDASAASQLYVGAMSTSELREAIEEPARRGDWEFVPGLVDLMLRDVGDEPGALPLLSHALLETWKRRRGTAMTLRSYAESGGVKGAIARTADRVYEGELSDEQRPIARNIFVRLTELGEGTQDTRRRARLAELLPADLAEAAAVRRLIGALADARLITVGEDDVEVAHEALIREWPTLRDWLTADREGLRIHRRLTEAASEWELAAFDDGLLYRGARLAQVRDWAAANPASLNDIERRFLADSVARSEREEAEREAQRQRELEAARALAESERRSAAGLRRRALLLAGALGVAALLAGVAIVLARQSSENAALADQHAEEARANATEASQNAAQASDSAALAEQRTREAQANLDLATSQRLGAEADSVIGGAKSGELAALLALNGLGIVYTRQADAALQHAARLYLGEQVFVHDAEAFGAAVTPDGRTLITTSLDTLLFWDLGTGRRSATLGAGGRIGGPPLTLPSIGLSLSRDGALLLASSGEVFRLPDRTRVRSGCTFADQVKIDSPPIVRTLSPDGLTIATALQDGGIILEPVDACRQGRRRLDGDVFSGSAEALDPSRAMSFSPDGRRLAGVTGNTVTLWDTSTGHALATLRAGNGRFGTVAFSPDGRRIVAANGNGSAYIFDARNGVLVRAFVGGALPLVDATFSPDGRRLLTGSADSSAALWDVATGRQLQRFRGHTRALGAVAFAPDGASVFTTSLDGTARRWLTDAPTEIGVLHAGTGEVRGLAFSADGRLLATGSEDRVQVHDLVRGTLVMNVLSSPIDRIALSPDGGTLLIASDRGSSLWEVASGHSVRPFGVQGTAGGSSGTAGFLRDGSEVIANSADGGLAVWSAPSGETIRSFRGIGTKSATVSADGSTVAYEAPTCGDVLAVDAATGDTRIQIRDSTEPGQFGAPGSCVRALALARDGSQLVTADNNERVQLWDLDTGKVVRSFPHPGLVDAVAVSSDGRFVLTGGVDGTARPWDLASGALVRFLPGHAGLPVAAVAISADGKLLAIGGSDGTVIVTPSGLSDLETSVCSRLLRDLTPDERTEFAIPGTTATCP
jgi:WD40 repeat protein